MGCNGGCNCVEKALGKLFYRYGHFLAKHPWPFVIVPPMVTVLLAIGLTQINLVSDAEYLYVPTDAPSKDERALVQDLFPENDTHLFTFTRKTEITGFLQIVITTPTETNILTNTTFQAIFDLDKVIRNLKVTRKEAEHVFDNDICAKWMDNCAGNILLHILENQNVETFPIRFPVHDGKYVLTSSLLSVTTDDNDIVQTAEAVMLTYNGRYLTDEDRELTDAWFEESKPYLLDYTSDVIDIVFQTSNSLEEELDNSVGSVLPLFSVSYVILLNFAVFSTLMLDWVRAKPSVALAGEGAALFGTISALGLMCACGVPFASVVGSTPFLIIGIGLDDLFIIISAWRYTDYTLDVPERVALTFKSAAVSITLTSVTDALAFCVGAITPFKSVQLFCAYTGVAIVFAYIYMITFTGAILVLSGRAEANNRHGLTWKKIKPKSQCSEKSKAYIFCCTGGVEIIDVQSKESDTKDSPQMSQNGNKHSIDSTEDKTHDHSTTHLTMPAISKFLTNYFAPFLMKTPIKISVMLLYGTYLGVAIWGCTRLKEGLELSSLAPDDSYLIPFFDKFDKHFRSSYGPVVSLTFTDSLDYTNLERRSQIDDVVNVFQESEFFYADDFAVNFWLYNFDYYLSMSSRSIAQNITSMAQLIYILKTEFLTIEGFDAYKQDIVFNADYTQISSSRLFIQGVGSNSTAKERELLVQSRKRAEDSNLSISVFSPSFIYFDQFDVVLVNTMQNLAIAVGAMFVVSLLFIPSLVAVLWVTLATVSICTGVIGYMALWDVSLDSVSMINLVMCIGFSVDFAAHISYHFVTCKATDPNDKAKEALGQLGTPIFQGALSTVLGVLILSASNTYIFRTAFKLVFLVMIFGFFHALFVLPIILSWLSCKSCGKKPRRSYDINTESPWDKSTNIVLETKADVTKNDLNSI